MTHAFKFLAHYLPPSGTQEQTLFDSVIPFIFGMDLWLCIENVVGCRGSWHRGAVTGRQREKTKQLRRGANDSAREVYA